MLNINKTCQWDQNMYNGYENHSLLWCPKINTLTFSPFHFQNSLVALVIVLPSHFS